jgi:hypothetical protein
LTYRFEKYTLNYELDIMIWVEVLIVDKDVLANWSCRGPVAHAPSISAAECKHLTSLLKYICTLCLLLVHLQLHACYSLRVLHDALLALRGWNVSNAT